MKNKTKDKKNKGKKNLYIGSNIFGAVFALVFIVIFTVTTALTLNINIATKNLSNEMMKVNDYQQSATLMQTGTSILSETATSFVHAPAIPNGQGGETINTEALGAYANELKNDRRPAKIVELFESYDVTEEVLGYILEAANYSTQMFDLQTHAISIIASVYALPPTPDFALIPLVELTAEEQAMSSEARLGLARSLIAQREYATYKTLVGQNIENCHRVLQIQLNETYEESQNAISAMRNSLWIVISLFAVSLLTTIVIFYFWNVKPLRDYAKDMQDNRLLEPTGRIKELHSIVGAYNELIVRRNELESILRTAAEKDTLTGLKNRYCMENDTIDIEKSASSVGIVFFDVDYLKKTNDQYGHLRGDELLKKVAKNIKTYFGTESYENCYRIGGDEFAVVLYGSTEEEIQTQVQRIIAANQKTKISVSLGYAFKEKLETGDFAKLIELADKRMYEHKKIIHGDNDK